MYVVEMLAGRQGQAGWRVQGAGGGGGGGGGGRGGGRGGGVGKGENGLRNEVQGVEQ